jgi:hypothetical protein
MLFGFASRQLRILFRIATNAIDAFCFLVSVKFLYMIQINLNYQVSEIAEFRDKISEVYNIMKINPL